MNCNNLDTAGETNINMNWNSQAIDDASTISQINEELIIPTSSDKQKQLAPRPKNGCLDNSNLEKIIDFKFNNIDSGISPINEI